VANSVIRAKPKWYRLTDISYVSGGTKTVSYDYKGNGFLRVARDTRIQAFFTVQDSGCALVSDTGSVTGMIAATVEDNKLKVSNSAQYSVVPYYFY